MKLHVEFLNLLKEQEDDVEFCECIATGKFRDGDDKVTFEIGFDEKFDRMLIVFEDAEYTTEIMVEELLSVARKFATRNPRSPK